MVNEKPEGIAKFYADEFTDGNIGFDAVKVFILSFQQ